ncbi:antibiotic transporter [Gordonia defluvii]|jgi:ABC-2 type transport system permease protein|uniref:Antibiotic transporter n=1 Tax=Gordonia defluvii TaxID=283718 RepID=A0ABP6LQ44_9ACTN|nr:ABC transporter permease [Gordonia sp. UBA5067]
MRQWWALSMRVMASIARNGEFVTALLSPVLLAVCFYLPMRSMMNQAPGMDYAAFLMPIITLQSVAFAASAAAIRVAMDRVNRINIRFRSLPMPLLLPASARLAANAALLIVSLACAVVVSVVIGWRPGAGISGTVGLLALAFGVGIGLVLLADGIGLLAGSPAATSQVLALPVLVLGMLSSGFMPAERFPQWIAPFVRHQPISRFAEAMRAFNDGTATAAVIAPAVWWCAGLLVLGAALVVAGTTKGADS